MTMIKRFITSKFGKKKENEKKSYNPDPAAIFIEEGKYILLHETGDQLSTMNFIKAKGTWENGDFILFKKKLKAGLSTLAANVILLEVDFGEISLSPHSSSLHMKDLFNFCVNLITVTLPDASHYQGEVNFEMTFCGCSKLKQINNFNTYKKISNFSGTFQYCSALSSIEILHIPLPKGNSETFQKVNKDIVVTIPKDAEIPSTWSPINLKNIIRREAGLPS